MGAVTEALFKIQFDTSQPEDRINQLVKNSRALGEIKNTLSLDTSSAEQRVIQLGGKIAADLSNKKAVIDADVKPAEDHIKELSDHSTGIFNKMRDGFSSIFKVSVGTAIGQGISGIFSGFIDKAHLADKASDDLSIGLAKAGITGLAAQAQIEGLGNAAAKIADDFAVPQTQVTELQARIAGFGNVSGDQLNKLTEFSLGAASALQLPAEAVARLIAKSSDPEQEAALSRLGIVFEKNASAAEKMAVVEAKLGPVVEAAKRSTLDAVGGFDRLVNSLEEAALGFASKSFESLQPVFQLLTPAITGVASVLGGFATAFGSVTHFAIEHRTALIALVGAYTAFRVASAISNAGGIISVFESGFASANKLAAGILTRLIPAYGAKTLAEARDIAAMTAHLTVEQTLQVAQLKSVGFTTEQSIAKLGLAAAETTGTVATGQAAVAHGILNAVMSANPVFLLLGGVVLLTTAFLLFSGGTKELGEATKDATESLTKFHEAAGRSIDADKQVKSLTELAGQYDELSGKPNRTAEETATLTRATNELVKSVPEAVDKYDAFSGSLTIATDRVRQFAAEQKHLSDQDKEDALRDLNNKTHDLANSYKAAAEQAASLDRQRQNLANVGSTLTTSSLILDYIGLSKSQKAQDDELLHEKVKINDEIKKAKPELQANLIELEKQGRTAQSLAAEYGLTLEQVTKITGNIQAAAAAEKDHLQTVTELAKKYDDARVAEEAQLNGSKSALKEIDRQIKEAQSNGGDSALAILTARRQEIIKNAIAEAKIHKDSVKEDERIDKELGLAKAVQGKDLLQIAIKNSDQAANELEIRTRIARGLAGQKFSEQDALDVAQERFKILGSEIERLKLFSNTKYKLNASVTLDQDQIKVLEATQTVKLRIKADAEALEKFKTDMTGAIAATKFKEIEIGLRPKSDALPLLQEKIDDIQSEIDSRGLKLLTLDLQPEEFRKLQLEVLKLQQDKLGAQKDYHDKSLSIDKELQDARIANILKTGTLENDDLLQQKARLDQKLAADLDYFNERIKLSGSLTDSERQIREEIEFKAGRDLIAINKKIQEEKYKDVIKFGTLGQDAIIKAATAAFDASKKLSLAEANVKRDESDKSVNALNLSYQRGEISARDFNDKLAKLTKERTDFEESQNAFSVKRFTDGLASGYNAALKEVGNYFSALAVKYFLDSALSSATETVKTAEVSAGTATRIAAMQTEIVSLRSLIAAKTGDAIAGTAAANASLGPFGFLLALAEGAAVSIGIQALLSAIKIPGFATGGAIVGERGPELITPMRDASFMATSMVRGVTHVVRDEMRKGGSFGGGASNTHVSFDGKLLNKGSDLIYALQSTSIKRDTEALLEGQTITFTSSTGAH